MKYCWSYIRSNIREYSLGKDFQILEEYLPLSSICSKFCFATNFLSPLFSDRRTSVIRSCCFLLWKLASVNFSSSISAFFNRSLLAFKFSSVRANLMDKSWTVASFSFSTCSTCLLKWLVISFPGRSFSGHFCKD